MRIDLGIYCVLLAGGLGFAYWASLPAVDDEQTKVPIMTFEPGAVTELTFASDEVTSTASKMGDGKKFWVTLTKTEKPPEKSPEKLKDGEKPAEAAAEPTPTPPPSKTDTFLANEQMEDLLSSLNPLQALRVVGKVEDEKMLEEFGLKDAKVFFSVATGDAKTGKKLELKIGKKSYGSSNRFVQNSADGKVYLVDEGIFEKLKKADFRLFERKIVSINFEDATKAQVRTIDKEKAMVHTKRDEAGVLQWSDNQEGANIKPAYKNWLDKVEKLKIISYANEAQKTALDAMQPFLTIKLEKDGADLDTIEFRKIDPDPGVDTSKLEKDGKIPSTLTYWVKSQFLQSYGKIGTNRVEVIEKDIPSIME